MHHEGSNRDQATAQEHTQEIRFLPEHVTEVTIAEPEETKEGLIL